MNCETCALDSLKTYKYVVIFARHCVKWVFCKHRERTTWETAGGHIEKGESPLDAAKRELYEESGAADFTITPACDYWAGDETSRASGVVFYADIARFDRMPDSEMERAELFDDLPTNLTYPMITPILFDYIKSKRF